MTINYSAGMLLPCRTYMYLTHENAKPWGISYNILNDAPFLPLISPRIQVDNHALEAERDALTKMNWTTSEIYVSLSEAGIIEPVELETPMRDAAKAAPETVAQYRQKLDEAVRSPNLYRLLTEMDVQLHGPAALTLGGDATVILDDSAPSPVWLRREKVIRDIFLGSDFRLLPRLEDLGYLERKTVIESKRKVSAVQSAWAAKLAKGEKSNTEYLDEIHDQKVEGGTTEAEEDSKVDDILRAHTDPNFDNMTISEKLETIITAREEFLPRFSELVSDSRLDDKTFQDKLTEIVDEKAQKILSTEAKLRSRVRFAKGGGFLTALGGALATENLVLGSVTSGVGISIMQPYFKALAKYYDARGDTNADLGLVKIDLSRRFRGDSSTIF